MQRPTGVTVLAVVAAIGGLSSLLGGLGLLGIGAVFAAYSGIGALASLFGLIILALGVAQLAIAYGFWTLKPWAWTWGITLEAVGVLISLVELVLSYGSISSFVIGVVIAGIVIYYLNMPDIRRAFAAPDKGWPFIGNIGS